MRWTALAVALVTASFAGLKEAGIAAFAAWPWAGVLAPATVFAGLWGLILVGTFVHFITRRIFGFDDSKGID